MANIRANLAPEEISSIDDLVKEGKERFNTKVIIGKMDGPVMPEADLYFSMALKLMHEQGIQNPEKEVHIEFHLATYLGFRGRYKEAIPHFERCVELNPDDSNARQALAKVYKDAGEHKKSAQQFVQLAKLSRILSVGRYTSYLNAAVQYSKAP